MGKFCSSLFFFQPKELDPSAVLPLDCLLAFVFFDANWCGYLHRRDLERILLTLGLRLSAEQVPSLASPRSFLRWPKVCTGTHSSHGEPGGPSARFLHVPGVRACAFSSDGTLGVCFL